MKTLSAIFTALASLSSLNAHAGPPLPGQRSGPEAGVTCSWTTDNGKSYVLGIGLQSPANAVRSQTLTANLHEGTFEALGVQVANDIQGRFLYSKEKGLYRFEVEGNSQITRIISVGLISEKNRNALGQLPARVSVGRLEYPATCMTWVH